MAAYDAASKPYNRDANFAGFEVTDDAAVCEYAGLSVTLVPGHRDALKITESLLHELMQPELSFV